MSLDEVAEKLETSYEFIRRLENGTALPSKYKIRELSDLFGLEYEELSFQVALAQVRKKHGAQFLARLAHRKGPGDLDVLWDSLNLEQKNAIVMMAEAYVQQNLSSKAVATHARQTSR